MGGVAPQPPGGGSSGDDGSGSGMTGDGGSSVPTRPEVGFDPNASFSNGTTPILTGRVGAAAGVAGVELFNGDTDFGSANVNGDGTWTFQGNIGTEDFNDLRAVATDSLGQTATASAPYELVTGIRGEPYQAQEFDYSPDGDSYGYTDYGKDGAPLVNAFDNGDGTHSIFGQESGQILESLGNDTMTGAGVRERFVFTPGFGQDEITDFYATSPQHDTIDLSNTQFHTLAQVLRHTTMGDGSATIHLNPHDSITLDGITKAQLKAHPKDFAFG